jgi:phage tail protein X
MKDPALKTAAALCVVLAGLCAASLFRHDRPRTSGVEADARQELLLRYRAADQDWKTQLRGVGRTVAAQADPDPAPASPPVTILTPADGDEPPPALAPGYPENEPPAKPRWGVAMSMMLPAPPADDAPRTHTVVDGDTLAALADRYLGSAARADEIYRANREVLHDPTLLPIGVELKLPPRKGQAPPTAASPTKKSPKASLVPVK